MSSSHVKRPGVRTPLPVVVAVSTALGLANVTPAEASDAGTQGEAEAGLAEITVTAQRRTERLQDVPLSVIALDAVAIAAAGIDESRALGQLTQEIAAVRSGGPGASFFARLFGRGGD